MSQEQLTYLGSAAVHPVGESDAHWDVVQDEIARIEKADPTSPAGNKVETVGRIEGKAAAALFPGWAFYAFVYSNYVKEGADQKFSLALSLGHTLAVPPGPGGCVRLYHYGNYEAYGDLLMRNKVTIRNTADAKRVWDAFCDIHLKGWQGHGVERVSEREWKLGIYRYDQTVSEVGGTKTIVTRTHYMRVAIDPDSNAITAWESTADTTNRRLERSR